ncbi:carbonic anhydrase [Clostridium sp. SHJSY1]|uniref:beta-class carbonic anhydrase n=1 Tax=Clostridium sp. SHJSY1 TaxID=2942483 RepID=UPI0028746EF7|nr:carbonic anhydrase [Clostridium sp. SHJSY1]MDS0526420.1 carbonic anhydrase [Clostridium sp. SHJSY1]
MRKLDEILNYNSKFVEDKTYEQYATSKNPDKKIVVVSCMDTRLTDLLPKALNLKNGDAKIIKNAGAAIMHPFGSITRSIMVAIYEFNVDEILIVGHHGCGMCNLDTGKLIKKMTDRGISNDVIDTLFHSGIDVEKWLVGFHSIEESIKDSVEQIKNHPLIPKDIIVHGLVISPETGKLDVVVNGYKDK